MGKRRLKLTQEPLHVLLALAQGPRHGWGLIQEIEERSKGRIVFGPSSLYYILDKLRDEQMIVDVDPPADAAPGPHGKQRRYFAITEVGRTRLDQELEALRDLIIHADMIGEVP